MSGPKTSSISISSQEELVRNIVSGPTLDYWIRNSGACSNWRTIVRFQPLIRRVVATRAAKGICMPLCSWRNCTYVFKFPSSSLWLCIFPHILFYTMQICFAFKHEKWSYMEIPVCVCINDCFLENSWKRITESKYTLLKLLIHSV